MTERPWGSYEVLLDEPTCKVKKITVHAGKRLSLQSHKKRSEQWTIISGTGILTMGGSLDRLDEKTLQPGAIVVIPANSIHRIQAKPEENVVFIEIQTGVYFGEDDITRYEDDFGRI